MSVPPRVSTAEDVGNFDKDEANDTFELILDLREKQTLFTSVIHKELFLKRLKDNLAVRKDNLLLHALPSIRMCRV